MGVMENMKEIVKNMNEKKSTVCPTGKNWQNREVKIFKEKIAQISPELMKNKNSDLLEAREKEKEPDRKESSPQQNEGRIPKVQWEPEGSGVFSRYSEKSNYKPRSGYLTKLPFRNKNKINTLINKKIKFVYHQETCT